MNGRPEWLDEARAHALEAARLDARRIALQPLNAAAKLDYSFDLSTLGDAEVAAGRYDEALRRFREALPIRRELWEKDPANVFAGYRLVYMLARLGETMVLAGESDRAEAPLREAIAVGRGLAPERQGETSLARAYLFMGEAVRERGGDPCPWYAASRPLFEGLSGDLRYLVPASAARRDDAFRRLADCPRPPRPASQGVAGGGKPQPAVPRAKMRSSS